MAEFRKTLYVGVGTFGVAVLDLWLQRVQSRYPRLLSAVSCAGFAPGRPEPVAPLLRPAFQVGQEAPERVDILHWLHPVEREPTRRASDEIASLVGQLYRTLSQEGPERQGLGVKIAGARPRVVLVAALREPWASALLCPDSSEGPALHTALRQAVFDDANIAVADRDAWSLLALDRTGPEEPSPIRSIDELLGALGREWREASDATVRATWRPVLLQGTGSGFRDGLARSEDRYDDLSDPRAARYMLSCLEVLCDPLLAGDLVRAPVLPDPEAAGRIPFYSLAVERLADNHEHQLGQLLASAWSEHAVTVLRGKRKTDSESNRDGYVREQALELGATCKEYVENVTRDDEMKLQLLRHIFGAALAPEAVRAQGQTAGGSIGSWIERLVPSVRSLSEDADALGRFRAEMKTLLEQIEERARQTDEVLGSGRAIKQRYDIRLRERLDGIARELETVDPLAESAGNERGIDDHVADVAQNLGLDGVSDLLNKTLEELKRRRQQLSKEVSWPAVDRAALDFEPYYDAISRLSIGGSINAAGVGFHAVVAAMMAAYGGSALVLGARPPGESWLLWVVLTCALPFLLSGLVTWRFVSIARNLRQQREAKLREMRQRLCGDLAERMEEFLRAYEGLFAGLYEQRVLRGIIREMQDLKMRIDAVRRQYAAASRAWQLRTAAGRALPASAAWEHLVDGDGAVQPAATAAAITVAVEAMIRRNSPERDHALAYREICRALKLSVETPARFGELALGLPADRLPQLHVPAVLGRASAEPGSDRGAQVHCVYFAAAEIAASARAAPSFRDLLIHESPLPGTVLLYGLWRNFGAADVRDSDSTPETA